MGVIRTIALASFREAIRDRVLYTILLFSILMMASSHVVESLVISQKSKIVKDMGLGAISIFGLLISISIGVNIFFKEIKRLSSYALVSKPVSRWQVIAGKYAGALITLVVVIVLMGLILMLDTAAAEGRFDPYLLVGISMILLEFSIITAFALLFSTFCTPLLSGLLTGALYVLGHTVALLKDTSPVQAYISEYGLIDPFLLIPDLEKFNFKAEVVYRTLPSWTSMVTSVMYGIILVFMALFLSWLVIRRMDIK
jgi:ABC-type transport system involved in multi-copper enzyme maturation permease subunit